jgi:hypothetical protein
VSDCLQIVIVIVIAIVIVIVIVIVILIVIVIVVVIVIVKYMQQMYVMYVLRGKKDRFRKVAIVLKVMFTYVLQWKPLNIIFLWQS